MPEGIYTESPQFGILPWDHVVPASQFPLTIAFHTGLAWQMLKANKSNPPSRTFFIMRTRYLYLVYNFHKDNKQMVKKIILSY